MVATKRMIMTMAATMTKNITTTMTKNMTKNMSTFLMFPQNEKKATKI